MPDEITPAPPEELKPEAAATPAPRTVIDGSILIGVPAALFIVGSGVLNILAALGGWNPFHWHGRLWTGIFMIAAPATLGITAALPYEIRQRMPESAVSITVILCWVAFFWAACGGH